MFSRTDIRRLARIEEGVPLWGCAPGSPAALAGLRYGDIVLFVDGMRTKTAQEYVEAKGSPDESHEIVFRRGADVLTTTIQPGPSVWPDVTEHMLGIADGVTIWAMQRRGAPTSRN